eukprot:4635798-Prymnesium_polylepis.1
MVSSADKAPPYGALATMPRQTDVPCCLGGTKSMYSEKKKGGMVPASAASSRAASWCARSSRRTPLYDLESP